MGYTGFEVQYYTAPIYVCAFVAILAFCFSSDYFKERAFHLATASALAIVCFAILIGVLNNTGRYVLLCFGVAGVYAACESKMTRFFKSDNLQNCADPIKGPLVSIYVSNSSKPLRYSSLPRAELGY